MTIDELKIEPKFRDLIPKLTEEEFDQLEKNILEEGRVKEPIIVWNGVIVDGHHRYYILQKHPEIPYAIEEKEFANEYAAMAWACANQLGRRNLNDWQHDYLIGKRQENERLAKGNQAHDKDGRFASNHKSLSPTYGEDIADTASQIAKEEGVNRGTVYEDQKLSLGLDIAEEVVPGLKDKIINREIPVSKMVVRKLSKAAPDIQRKASIALSEGRIEDAKEALAPAPPSVEPEPYNIDDMIEEIIAAQSELHSALNQTLIVMHQEVLSKAENRDRVVGCLRGITNDVKMFISKLLKSEEE